jgi:hypothetical protein
MSSQQRQFAPRPQQNAPQQNTPQDTIARRAEEVAAQHTADQAQQAAIQDKAASAADRLAGLQARINQRIEREAEEIVIHFVTTGGQ